MVVSWIFLPGSLRVLGEEQDILTDDLGLVRLLLAGEASEFHFSHELEGQDFW